MGYKGHDKGYVPWSENKRVFLGTLLLIGGAALLYVASCPKSRPASHVTAGRFPLQSVNALQSPSCTVGLITGQLHWPPFSN